MRYIEIIARTEKGKEAMLKKGDEILDNFGGIKKRIFKRAVKKIVTEEIVNDEPLTIGVTLKSKRAEMMLANILDIWETKFKENGAEKDKDYVIEIS